MKSLLMPGKRPARQNLIHFAGAIGKTAGLSYRLEANL